MAASKSLDPSTTLSASEAFHHPLPQVRQFHRSLTSALDDKNERLRILVGGSYRQLLGTAETILQMRDDVSGVEDYIAKVGNGCGRAVIGTMVGGLGRLENARNKGSMKAHREEMSWAARMKVLEMCGILVGGLLRKGVTGKVGGKGKSLVLAAKILVLSRLLLKSLSDSTQSGGQDGKVLIEEARKKRSKLLNKLLRAIERSLEKVGEDADITNDREDLLQTLCAYALATSSGAKDILRHFLVVRGDAMAVAFETEHKEVGHGILTALRLYTRTLLDVQALTPKRLSDALANLKTKHLLEDVTIREIEGLRLDVCERWFGSEILNFTPYVRHDDLELPQAIETLKGWSKRGSEVLLAGFSKTLNRVSDFKTVVDVRTKILEVWIRDGGKARGFDPSVLLDGLREVINARLVQLLESRVNKLHLVGTEIEGTLGSWRSGITDKQESLWDVKMLNMEISNGGSLFKEAILARAYGKNDAVSKAVNGYQTWRHLIDGNVILIDQLKSQRWDDDLEDIEDDDVLESRNDILSRDDPLMLQDCLASNLETAFRELNEKISTLLATYQDSEHVGQISTYIIRILRSIRSSLPEISSLQSFGVSIIPILHKNIATIVCADIVQQFSKSCKKKRVAGRSLWEGTPELPVQPSLGTFKLLYNLSKAMANEGRDLWSLDAVGTLKKHLQQILENSWAELIEEKEIAVVGEKSETQPTNGDIVTGEDPEVKDEKSEIKDEPPEMIRADDTADGTADESKQNTEVASIETTAVAQLPPPTKPDPQLAKDVLIQCVFDILVLKSAFDVPEFGGGLSKAESVIVSQLDLEKAQKKRLEHGAKEYWKRTSLLFGLIAT